MADQERRVAERRAVSRVTEMIVDEDLLVLSSMDHSETGMKLQLPESMKLVIKFEQDGVQQTRHCQLVWSRRQAEGGMELGLQFVDPDLSANASTK